MRVGLWPAGTGLPSTTDSRGSQSWLQPASAWSKDLCYAGKSCLKGSCSQDWTPHERAGRRFSNTVVLIRCRRTSPHRAQCTRRTQMHMRPGSLVRDRATERKERNLIVG